jgi:hypothetical protein
MNGLEIPKVALSLPMMTKTKLEQGCSLSKCDGFLILIDANFYEKRGVKQGEKCFSPTDWT